jgi:PPM family protein phosphatase
VDHSWGYGSDQRLREENQDCYGVFDFPDYTLAIVCDGMGGHVGGAHASTLAVRTIHDVMRELQGKPVLQALEEAIQRTNVVIHEAARKNHRLMGMGTTVVAAVIARDTVYLAHVGDSRAYLVRRSHVSQMTRDHTMVNLFVDAELLSPEDAATHPEAHVLSRSLGVERQVDVELSDPIPLEASDVLVLCSDGVHGIVTDWEIANVDWGAPHEAVREILRIVSAREGDDNATAVSVMMGTSFEDVPATPVPEPKRFEDGVLAPTGMTAVPVDEELEPVSVSRSLEGGGAGHGYVVYEDHPVVEPPDRRQPDATPPPVPLTTPPSSQRTTPTGMSTGRRSPKTGKAAKAKVQRRRPLWLLPVAFAGSALFSAVCAVGGLLLLPYLSSAGDDQLAMRVDPVAGGLDPLPTAPADPAGADPALGEAVPPVPEPEAIDPAGDGVAEVEAVEPRPDDPGESVQRTGTASKGSEATQCPVEGYLLKPVLPVPTRRLPSRPSSCTQAPPGGPDTQIAIDRARRDLCAESLVAVQSGMKKSIDHCGLYKSAWLCFNEVHQMKLEAVESDTWGDLVLHLPHFNGTREAREAQYAKPEHRGLPHWYIPAADGVEFRLEAWTLDQQMQEVVADLFGSPTVADQLAKDLHLEALTAAGLACQPPRERTRAMEDAWARRVYVLARSLHGQPGALIDAHRSQLMVVLRELLEDSVSDYVDDRGNLYRIPGQVRDAYEVGVGNRPPPNPRPATVRPRGPTDPTIPDDFEVRIDGRK